MTIYLSYQVSVDRRETTTGMNPVAEETVADYLISPFFSVANVSHKQNVSLSEGPFKKCSSLTHVTYHITDLTVF